MDFILNLDELAALAFIPAAISLSELVAALIRQRITADDKKFIKKQLFLLAQILSITSIFGVLFAFMYIPLILANIKLENIAPSDFDSLLILLGILFVSSAVFIHFLGYCFSGVLNKWPFEGVLWPKSFDYIYYICAFVLLITIAAGLYDLNDFVTSISKTEIIIGVYLLNLKIFKTSYELFPNKYQHKEYLIRDPILGGII